MRVWQPSDETPAEIPNLCFVGTLIVDGKCQEVDRHGPRGHAHRQGLCARETYRLLTKRFIGIVRKKATALKNLGHYLIIIVPRVTDLDGAVRELALDAIQMLLFVDQLLRNPDNEKPSDSLHSLNNFKKEMKTKKIG